MEVRKHESKNEWKLSFGLVPGNKFMQVTCAHRAHHLTHSVASFTAGLCTNQVPVQHSKAISR